MFRNYIKIAWRNILKDKTTYTISCLGLAIGITSFILLATYINNELRYDTFHTKADRIAFAEMFYKSAGSPEVEGVSLTGTAVVPVAKREIPGVENGTRVYDYSNRVFKYNELIFKEKNVYLADESFFSIFSFPFIEGNAQNALKNPNSLVLTRSAAKKYFGTQPALGKVLTKDTSSWLVTGVVEDLPSYSTLRFDMVGSYSSLQRSKTEEWSSANDISFLLLKPGADLKQVQRNLNTHIAKSASPELEAGDKLWIELEPLKQVHLYSKTAAQGSPVYLFMFATIAVLLLFIACVNFVNLVTAKSTQRTKEIGIRKTIGASKKNVFLQFISESALITFIALCIGLLAAFLLLPLFSEKLGLNITFQVWQPGIFCLTLLCLFILLSIFSGAWPALVISKFSPMAALKNKGKLGSSSVRLRRFLVVFQFTVSIVFIISAVIINKQLFFLQHTDTGFNRNEVVVVEGSSFNANKLATFKAELLKTPGIKSVTASYDLPTNVQGGYSLSLGPAPSQQHLNVTAIPVEKDFLKTLDIKILAGNDFNYTDEQLATVDDDTKRETAFIINESAAKALGLNLQKSINVPLEMNGRRGKLKAIVKDFNFSSLHNAITPIVIFTEYSWFGKLLIKTSGTDTKSILGHIEAVWKNVQPDVPFEYTFLNDAYSQLYNVERRTSMIVNAFSLIAIAIACLGLFGLSMFIVVQRTKEIGIRKVMGARASQIAVLISKDFLKLVIIAIFIAIPVAWYFANRWLADFAYRIPVTAWNFVAAALSVIAIAGITISIHAVKAAIANPVKSLRSE